MSEEEENLKSEYAKTRPRDDEGHFLPEPDEKKDEKESTNPVMRFLHNETAVHKSKDDELLDIHIGNPLRRITDLLEQIKKQKAFSFTLKGSLGIMGVVLVAGTFGILGGSKALCDKGTQTKIGEVRELVYKENSEKSFLSYVPFLESFFPDRKIPRKIIITPDNKVLHLFLRNGTSLSLNHQPLAINHFTLTGSYDSCSETLTVDDQTGVQEFFK